MLASRNDSVVVEVPPRVHREPSFVLPFEHGIDHVLVTRLLEQYWHHSITISILYFLTVKAVEYWMRDRKPLELRGPLLAWNALLAAFSLLGLSRTADEFFATLYSHGVFVSVCHAFTSHSVVAHWFLWFSLSKLVEFGDTLFLVLRKRPLTFLHCYHHMSVLVYTVHAGSEHIGAGRWFMFMNFVAHSLMYSYFTITSLGIRLPKMMSMLVTTVQITQMLVGVLISLSVFAIKTLTDRPCRQSFSNLGLCFFIYVSYAALFLRFFHSTYLSKEKKEKKEKTT